MNQSNININQVLVTDIAEPLEAFMVCLKNHCVPDTVYSTQDVFVTALNYLQFDRDRDLKEAIESMMMDICGILDFPNKRSAGVLTTEHAVKNFLTTLHQFLRQWHLYDSDGELQHTLGGWIGDYTPYLIPRLAIPFHASAVSSEIGSHYDVKGAYDKRMIEQIQHQFHWMPSMYMTHFSNKS
jgi:hypothetical protein